MRYQRATSREGQPHATKCQKKAGAAQSRDTDDSTSPSPFLVKGFFQDHQHPSISSLCYHRPCLVLQPEIYLRQKDTYAGHVEPLDLF